VIGRPSLPARANIGRADLVLPPVPFLYRCEGHRLEPCSLAPSANAVDFDPDFSPPARPHRQ
jgi:hypothetical protein